MRWRPRARQTQIEQPPADVVPVEGMRGVNIHAFRVGLVGGLGVLVALLIGSVFTQLGTVLIYVGLALFIALGLDPLVSWLERKMPRGLAIGIVVLMVLVVFAALLFAIIPLIITQVTNLVTNFDEISGDLLESDFVQWVQQLLGSNLDIDHAIENVTTFLQNPENLISLGGGIAAVGAGVAGGVTGAIIVLILTLYFLASLRAMKRVVYRFVPAYRREGFARITEEITSAVGRYVVGQVSLALINGILSLIFLTIIGAPVPYLLAFVAFLGSLVPLVGTLTGSIVNTLVCLFVSPLTALIAGIYYLIYMQIEAYVISPRIMSRAVAVPGAVVVIAAVAGGAIGGILGALVAIPVAASAIIIVQKVIFPRQDSRLTPS